MGTGQGELLEKLLGTGQGELLETLMGTGRGEEPENHSFLLVPLQSLQDRKHNQLDKETRLADVCFITFPEVFFQCLAIPSVQTSYPLCHLFCLHHQELFPERPWEIIGFAFIFTIS